jgi:hypothetical protein
MGLGIMGGWLIGKIHFDNKKLITSFSNPIFHHSNTPLFQSQDKIMIYKIFDNSFGLNKLL